MSSLGSNRTSRSGRSAQSANSGQLGSANSSGTEEYEIPEGILINRRPLRNRASVIEINESQEGPQAIDDEEEDDDVILIPQHIETIDLCTQVPLMPLRRLRNQIIDITGSPAPNAVGLPPPVTRRLSLRASTRRSVSVGRDAAGPSRARRNNNRLSPYVSPAAASSPKTPAARTVSFDDSLNASQLSGFKISCPICLESVKERDPISTMCGHVFCKACIQAAMRTVKKCPMCKKNLGNKNPYIHLFI